MTVQTTDGTFAVPAGPERIERAAAALRKNGYVAHVVDTVAQARDLVKSLLPGDRAVFTANSETLRKSGLQDDIEESGEFRSVRKEAGDLGADMGEHIRLGALAEEVVGSVHAVTEDGRLVVASATGSQLAPYASGAKRVIWVVGAQKVVADLETALRRVREHSLPLEDERNRVTNGGYSWIGKILIMEQEFPRERGVVVLVRESIGF